MFNFNAKHFEPRLAILDARAALDAACGEAMRNPRVARRWARAAAFAAAADRDTVTANAAIALYEALS